MTELKTIKRPQPRPVPREAAEAEAGHQNQEVEDGGCTVLHCTVLYRTRRWRRDAGSRVKTGRG